VCVSL